jgi:hypothetical protein
MGKFILEGIIQRVADYRHNGRIYPENVYKTYFKRVNRKSKIKSLLSGSKS